MKSKSFDHSYALYYEAMSVPVKKPSQEYFSFASQVFLKTSLGKNAEPFKRRQQAASIQG
jgi:hypothetical protein